MKINNRILVFVVALLINVNACAQNKIEDNRLSLTRAFVQDLKLGILSNEDIMAKYVIEGSYSKHDSIKKDVDQFINDHRMGFNVKGTKFKFLKYAEHEDEFMVADHPIGEPETMHKLIFTLGNFNDGKETDINKDDLYVAVVTVNRDEGTFFILFDESNKIISFLGLKMGYYVTLFQY